MGVTSLHTSNPRRANALPPMHVHVKLVETPEEWAAARRLRLLVFVREQGWPLSDEFDEHDDGAIHAAALADGVVVGTGRAYTLPTGETLIGRMAVAQDYRREGVGGRVLAFLEERAASRGAASVTLNAQTYVRSFYERRGYRACGKPFVEEGIEHVKMTKRLR